PDPQQRGVLGAVVPGVADQADVEGRRRLRRHRRRGRRRRGRRRRGRRRRGRRGRGRRRRDRRRPHVADRPGRGADERAGAQQRRDDQYPGESGSEGGGQRNVSFGRNTTETTTLRGKSANSKFRPFAGNPSGRVLSGLRPLWGFRAERADHSSEAMASASDGSGSVENQASSISAATGGLTSRRLSTRTLASFHRRAPRAVSASVHSAART